MSLKKLIKEATKQGWEVNQLRTGHFGFICPECSQLIVSGKTHSDSRGILNHLANMRRHGFLWAGRYYEHAQLYAVGQQDSNRVDTKTN
jgi:hypothetical protein